MSKMTTCEACLRDFPAMDEVCPFCGFDEWEVPVDPEPVKQMKNATVGQRVGTADGPWDGKEADK